MSETLAQVRTRLKGLYDESYGILQKTGGVITAETSEGDRARLAENKGVIQEAEAIAARLLADEADTAMFTRGHDEYGKAVSEHRQPDPGGGFARSIGQGVILSEAYKAARDGGEFRKSLPSLRVALPEDVSLVRAAKLAGKALLTSGDASAGAFVQPDRLAGVTGLARGELAFLDSLPTLTTTSDLVEWVQQDTRTNNAAPVAEATATTGTSGAKPESALAYSVVSQGVENIATWVPVTTRILADAPMLRSTIDDELLYMLREELEEQCVIGNGTSPNLRGINNWAGIQTLAAGANPADAIFNAAMACRFTGGVPATEALVGPATLAALRLMRENAASGTLGGYLFGPPNLPGPMTIFGLLVTVAQATPANTAFVLNNTATTLALVERSGPAITTGWINDQFTRNMLTILAELRALLIVRRPKGIVKVTGMP